MHIRYTDNFRCTVTHATQREECQRERGKEGIERGRGFWGQNSRIHMSTLHRIKHLKLTFSEEKISCKHAFHLV